MSLADQAAALETANQRIKAERDRLKEHNRQLTEQLSASAPSSNLMAANAANERLRDEVTRLTQDIAELRSKLGSAVRTPKVNDAERERFEAQILKLTAKIDRDHETIVELGKQRAANIATIRQNEDQYRVELRDLHVQLGRVSATLSTKDAEVSRLRNERDDARKNRVPASGLSDEEARRLSGELASARAVVESTLKAKNEANARATKLQERLRAAEGRAVELTTAIDAVGNARRQARTESDDLERRFAVVVGENTRLRAQLTQVSNEKDIEIEGLNAKLRVAQGRAAT